MCQHCMMIHLYYDFCGFCPSLALSPPPSLSSDFLTAEYLFIARDEADLLGWVEAINRAIQAQESSRHLHTSVSVCTYIHVHIMLRIFMLIYA